MDRDVRSKRRYKAECGAAKQCLFVSKVELNCIYHSIVICFYFLPKRLEATCLVDAFPFDY